MKELTALARLTAALLIGWSVSSSRCSETKAQAGPAKPPELKILAKLVGHWKDDMTFLVPKQPGLTALYSNEWILGGRFLWSQGSSAGMPLDIQIMTYEPVKIFVDMQGKFARRK
jgi:hypothetical protein